MVVENADQNVIADKLAIAKDDAIKTISQTRSFILVSVNENGVGDADMHLIGSDVGSLFLMMAKVGETLSRDIKKVMRAKEL